MDLFRSLPADVQLSLVWWAVRLPQISLSGALMIAVVAILRSLALRRLPKKLFPAMWGLVLAPIKSKTGAQRSGSGFERTAPAGAFRSATG